MSAHLIRTIRETFVDKSVSELRNIYESRDLSQWSPAAIEAARQLLLERGESNVDDRPVVELPSEPKKVPVGQTCPSCGGTEFTPTRPTAWVAFAPDRICTTCETRYSLPTPLWAGLLFILIGLPLVGLCVALLLASASGAFHAARVVPVAVIGVVGALSLVHGCRSLFSVGRT